MHLDQNSYGTAALVLGICIVGFILLGFIPSKWISWALRILLIVFSAFVIWFHRVPSRNVAGGPSEVTAVADGKIVVVEKVYESEYLKRDCILVATYMNFFDVHANFWPMSGEITYYKYHPGLNKLAFLPKSSDLNEHSSSALKNEYGEIFFKQIAGTFARRIVCYSKEGSHETKGEQMGIIKFGSRIDMFLPLDAKVKVKPGDLVRACETVIAEL